MTTPQAAAEREIAAQADELMRLLVLEPSHDSYEGDRKHIIGFLERQQAKLTALEAELREARTERDRVMLLWKHERQLERERVRKLDAALDAAGVARERQPEFESDSLGVYGSTFLYCPQCGGGTEPGKRDNPQHKPECSPVPLTLPERLALLVEARDQWKLYFDLSEHREGGTQYAVDAILEHFNEDGSLKGEGVWRGKAIFEWLQKILAAEKEFSKRLDESGFFAKPREFQSLRTAAALAAHKEENKP